MGGYSLLDYALSQQAKEEGIEQVSLNNHEWLDTAVNSFEAYLRRNGPGPLEEWKVDFINSGGPAPKSVNAFGAVAATASRRKLIRCIGFRNAQSVSAHARLIRVWAIKD